LIFASTVQQSVNPIWAMALSVFLPIQQTHRIKNDANPAISGDIAAPFKSNLTQYTPSLNRARCPLFLEQHTIADRSVQFVATSHLYGSQKMIK